ncbi:MAG: hypothetical protein AAGA85_21180, partial [Bacteroidota bacterium]
APDLSETSLIGTQAPGAAKHYLPVGCDACHGTGYRGRRAIYEMIPIDKDIRELIKNIDQSAADEVERSITTLSQSAIALYNEGETSKEEILPYLQT